MPPHARAAGSAVGKVVAQPEKKLLHLAHLVVLLGPSHLGLSWHVVALQHDRSGRRLGSAAAAVQDAAMSSANNRARAEGMPAL